MTHFKLYTMLVNGNLHPVATDVVTAHDMLPDLVWSVHMVKFDLIHTRGVPVLCYANNVVTLLWKCRLQDRLTD